MRYDIVLINQKYRGIERVLVATDLCKVKGRKDVDCLLEEYYLYLERSQKVDVNNFKETIAFLKKIKNYGIPCEIIIYDKKPLDDAFGYSVDFLGIDIVHDMCESLISDEVDVNIFSLLNENGLCRTEQDITKIIPFQDSGNVEWEACYVYRLDD